MTDRDDAPRRELGWAGPEESDDEPETGGRAGRTVAPRRLAGAAQAAG